MGTGVEAMARTGARGCSSARSSSSRPPSTTCSPFEAETLVDDFLQEEGKHRYIIEDDESTRPGRIARLHAHSSLGLDAGCVVRFAQPLDFFGNRVDEDGVSYDSRGHAVSPASYLTDAGGRVVHDPARDAQYTRELAEALVGAYRRDTVAMATHLVAASAFEKLRASLGGGDIFAMLRSHDDVTVPRAELAESVARLRDRAIDLQTQGKILVGPHLAHATGREILDEALRAFSGYHTTPVLEPRGDMLLLADTRLLLYYQNRLASHGLSMDFAARGHVGLPGSLPRKSDRKAEGNAVGAVAKGSDATGG